MTASKSDFDPTRRNAGNGADGAGEGTTERKMNEDAQDVKREASVKARETVEDGQQRLADEAGTLSDAIDAAAANLDENDRDGLASYAREMSRKLTSAAGQLEGRSVDQLADDAKRLARDNPALFMLGSVAVGFSLSRFFKASEKHDRHVSQQSTHRNADVDASPVRRPHTGMEQPFATPATSPRTNGRDAL